MSTLCPLFDSAFLNGYLLLQFSWLCSGDQETVATESSYHPDISPSAPFKIDEDIHAEHQSFVQRLTVEDKYLQFLRKQQSREDTKQRSSASFDAKFDATSPPSFFQSSRSLSNNDREWSFSDLLKNIDIDESFDPRNMHGRHSHLADCFPESIVENQGQCGSCYIFATLGAAADRQCVLDRGNLIDGIRHTFSAQQLLSCMMPTRSPEELNTNGQRNLTYHK